MAYYDKKPSFWTVFAKSVGSGEEALLVRHPDEVVKNSSFLMEPFKKIPVHILDVTGSRDGANSVVTSQWVLDGACDVKRVKETPDELKRVFHQAGCNSPPVTKSLGLMTRKFIRSFGL